MRSLHIAIAVLMSFTPLATSSIQTQATTSTPPHRRHHALTYDAVGKRVLMAGGQHLVSNTETPVMSDLWSWDGAQWTELSSRTGIPMITHKMFVDDAGGVFAMLSQGLAARWDGAAWQAITSNWNARRESAAGAYDTSRRQFVTFGGLVGGRAFDTSGETWGFDGKSWLRVTTEGPSPTLGSAMAYDTRRKTMVLFGGLDATGKKLGDTWEWNGAKWTQVSTTAAPPARFGAGIAYDQKRGETIIFGGVGADDRKLNDTWRFDGRTWRRADTAQAPAARSEGYLAYDAARGVTVMFGGEGSVTVPTFGDTWEWDGMKWTRRQ